jgi:hypothetical protein
VDASCPCLRQRDDAHAAEVLPEAEEEHVS